MVRVNAKWHGAIIAETEEEEIVMVEGNSYFPASSVNREFLQDSSYTSMCPWKGNCIYYDLVVEGTANKAAAWCYPDPKPAAINIKGYIAFWKGVVVGCAVG